MRTIGQSHMSVVRMRRLSGCHEIFTMAIGDAHNPPIPRPPEIPLAGLNGHINCISNQGISNLIHFLNETSKYILTLLNKTCI